MVEFITKDDVEFIIQEVFTDFYESGIDKNKSGNYDDDLKKLEQAEIRLWNTLKFLKES